MLCMHYKKGHGNVHGMNQHYMSPNKLSKNKISYYPMDVLPQREKNLPCESCSYKIVKI